MKIYHNPQPREGINTSKSHPLWTFVKLFLAIAIILLVAAWVLGQSGSWLAARIPYQQEVKISQRYLEASESVGKSSTHKNPEIQQYLQTLVNQLEKNMQLPEGMHIQVHYEAEEVANAFATLGGHIFMYKGLLEKLPNENSVAMLLAHEMAHVKLRHPIRATGQTLAISTGIKYLLGYSDMDLLGKTGLYTQLHFSRGMESAADAEGLETVYKTYGTVAGAAALFETLQKVRLESGIDNEPPFFSTHPLDDQRIQHLKALAKDRNWTRKGDVISLPEGYDDWL